MPRSSSPGGRSIESSPDSTPSSREKNLDRLQTALERLNARRVDGKRYGHLYKGARQQAAIALEMHVMPDQKILLLGRCWMKRN